MQRLKPAALVLTALVVLAACDNGGNKASTPPSPPVSMACTTPAEAGKKAQDITRKLGEALSAKRISDDDFRAYTATLGTGLQAWSERQDLKGYCAALDKVVNDAGLQ
ncbi:MAG: hypothetical protein GC190_20300 [Alphaproteobacteria bacterium]|nr:hypothetical protein [Alphaproteobacteria bacterium]